MKNKKCFICSMLSLLLLNGCSGSLNIKPGYDQKNKLLDQVNKDARGDQGWFEFTSEDNINKSYSGTIPGSIALYLDRGIYFIDDQPTIAHIKSVLATLLQNWEGPEVDIPVLIKASPNFDARTDEYGQIILTVQFLKTIKSDDELAAALAHELSHLLLNHNGEKDFYTSMLPFLEESTTLALIASEKKSGSSSNKFDNKNYAYATTALWGDVLTPAMSQENEVEADLLGLDLYLKAGYNPEAFFHLISKLQAHQIKHSKNLENLATIAFQDIYSDIGDRKKDTLKAVAYQMLLNEVMVYFKKKNADYVTPEEREGKVKEYYATLYEDLDELMQDKMDIMQKINAGQWISYQGDENHSVNFVRKTEYVPLMSYTGLAKQFINEKNYPQSREILSLGVDRIGREYNFLPELIKLEVAEGNMGTAQAYVDKCQKNHSGSILGSTISTVTGKLIRGENQSKYYKFCASLLGDEFKEDPINNSTASSEKDPVYFNTPTSPSIPAAQEVLDIFF